MTDDDNAAPSLTPHTWADGFGVWHARVRRGMSTPLLAVRRALRDELAARQAPGTLARQVWVHPVRVPDLDDEETIVYRERFVGEDADLPVSSAIYANNEDDRVVAEWWLWQPGNVWVAVGDDPPRVLWTDVPDVPDETLRPVDKLPTGGTLIWKDSEGTRNTRTLKPGEITEQHPLIGKTVAEVTSGTSPSNYGDEPTTVLLFTDGSQWSFVHPRPEEEDEPEDEPEIENECPNCNESFDDPPGSGPSGGGCDISEAHVDVKRDSRPGPVMTVGEHRQSADGPFIDGPFNSYGEAREFAVEQYLSGDWDPHGYTFEYRKPGN